MTQIHGRQIKDGSITAAKLAFTAASQAYVDQKISDLVAGAGAALNTLQELAAALNNDANFANTVTTALAGKLALTGGTMQGVINMGGFGISSLGTPSNPTDAATKGYVDSAVSGISYNAGDGIDITSGTIKVKAQAAASSGLSVSGTGVALAIVEAAVLLATRWVINEAPSGLIDGTNQDYSTANAFVTGKLQVYLNGVLQEAGAGNDYTVSGTTITFADAPQSGDKILVSYIRS